MSTATESGTAATARTDPHSPDPLLRGRTYAIFFDRVWGAACALADDGMSRWRVLHSDDQTGVIEAEATSLVLRVADHVHIAVALDENAQTRVDMSVRTPKPLLDLGRGRKLVHRFFKRLDARVGATPARIIDSSRRSPWSA